MFQIFRDKYFIFCFFVGFLIIFSTSFVSNPISNETVGLVFDVKETSNGNVFDLTTSNGNIIHCFSKDSVSNGNIILISEFEESDGIIFVRSLTVLS